MSTTLTAAVNATARVFSLASTAGAHVGDCLAVDSELARITAVITGACEVQRGSDGTAAVSHLNGAEVTIGPPGVFVPSGALLPAFGPDATVWAANGPTVVSGFEQGGTGSPALPSGSIQFNQSGAFAGDAGLLFDPDVNKISVTSGFTIEWANEISTSGLQSYYDNGWVTTLSAGSALLSLSTVSGLSQLVVPQDLLITAELGMTLKGTGFSAMGEVTPASDGMGSLGTTDLQWGSISAMALTRDSGDLTISTTTSGDIKLLPDGDFAIGAGSEFFVGHDGTIFGVGGFNQNPDGSLVTANGSFAIDSSGVTTIVNLFLGGGDGGLITRNGADVTLQTTVSGDVILDPVDGLKIGSESGVTGTVVVPTVGTLHFTKGIYTGLT